MGFEEESCDTMQKPRIQRRFLGLKTEALRRFLGIKEEICALTNRFQQQIRDLKLTEKA